MSKKTNKKLSVLDDLLWARSDDFDTIGNIFLCIVLVGAGFVHIYIFSQFLFCFSWGGVLLGIIFIIQGILGAIREIFIFISGIK